MSEGHFSRRIEGWQAALLNLSAMAEAALDFSDEDDVPDDAIERRITSSLADLADELGDSLSAPSAERLRDGIRVVLAGPPNAGKSTLLNALVGREAAIVSDIAGTTRDRIEVPAALGGTAFLFTDTAGLRESTSDVIESIGMDRARAAVEAADIILWLGEAAQLPRADAIQLAAQCDRQVAGEGVPISALTGEGMEQLIALLLDRASKLLPSTGNYALHERQRKGVRLLRDHVQAAAGSADLLIIAEELRQAREVIDRLTGRASTEDMLDKLFGGFCIGK
jgi:tRNA modification GTPase